MQMDNSNNTKFRPIGIGTEVFHKLIEEHKYYVDKTLLLRTVFQENGAEVLLITRPRRFGKTLTLSTFRDFLSLDHTSPGDISRQEKWFQETAIYSDRDFCQNYMGRFPVVSLSLKSVSFDNFSDAYNELAAVITSLAEEFSYLEDSPELNRSDRLTLNRLLDHEQLRDPSDKTALTRSLLSLTNLLYRHHQSNPVLLIDEYDVPIAKAARFGYYNDMIRVVRPLLANALKGNTNMKKAVITGCLPGPAESIFTELSNFQNCSLLDDGNSALFQGIGFTEEETRRLLACYDLEKHFAEVKRSYDGYNCGSTCMYCPWDVLSFCNDSYEKAQRGDDAFIKPGNYWLNTSSNDAIEEFMEHIESKDAEKMQVLLDGGSITAEVREALCYGNLRKHSTDDFWTLLLYTGYLTFDPKYHSSTSNENKLFIPNAEIRSCFEAKILDFFRSNHLMTEHTRELVKSLFAGDADRAQQNLQSLLAKYVSIRDFTSKAPKENYYHGFLNGLLINWAAEIHEQSSNLESGDGYIDLIASSSQNSGIIIILELKQTDSLQSDKMQIARKAIKQIMDRKYADPYIHREDITGVYAWGICFHRKSCSLAVEKLK